MNKAGPGLFKFDLRIEAYLDEERAQGKALDFVDVVKPGTLLAVYHNGSKTIYNFTYSKERKVPIFDKFRFDEHQEKPKFLQSYSTFLVTLSQSDPSSPIRLNSYSFLPDVEPKFSTTLLSYLGGARYVFVNEDGIRIFTDSQIIVLEDIGNLYQSTTQFIPLQFPLDFHPSSISIHQGKIGLLTSKLKIYLINMIDGSFIYKQNKNLPTPLTKVQFNDNYIIGITSTQLLLVDIKQASEKFVDVGNPTGVLLMGDYVVVGDIEGRMRLFRLPDLEEEGSYVMDNFEKSSGILKQNDCFIGKISQWRNGEILCYQPKCISMWELKDGFRKVTSLDIPHRIIKFKQFDKTIQMYLENDQFWVWSPDLSLSQKPSPKKLPSPTKKTLRREFINDPPPPIQTPSRKRTLKRNFSGNADAPVIQQFPLKPSKSSESFRPRAPPPDRDAPQTEPPPDDDKKSSTERKKEKVSRRKSISNVVRKVTRLATSSDHLLTFYLDLITESPPPPDEDAPPPPEDPSTDTSSDLHTPISPEEWTELLTLIEDSDSQELRLSRTKPQKPPKASKLTLSKSSPDINNISPSKALPGEAKYHLTEKKSKKGGVIENRKGSVRFKSVDSVAFEEKKERKHGKGGLAVSPTSAPLLPPLPPLSPRGPAPGSPSPLSPRQVESPRTRHRSKTYHRSQSENNKKKAKVTKEKKTSAPAEAKKHKEHKEHKEHKDTTPPAVKAVAIAGTTHNESKSTTTSTESRSDVVGSRSRERTKKLVHRSSEGERRVHMRPKFHVDN